MELIVYAPVWGHSGFEQVSRGLLLALDQIGVNIELRPADEWNGERIGLPQNVLSRLSRMTQTRVSQVAPHVIYQIPRGQPLAPDAPTICYTLFETDRCPSPWKDALLQMDKILVFSEFNRKSWIESGIPEGKIAALPPAIDSFVYNPNGPKLNITNKKGFTFLSSGDFTERKNFEALIEAYVKEFTSDEQVTLVLKCHYGGFIKRFRRECLNRFQEIVKRFNAENPPKILFYGDKISDQGMAALYRSADCFVLTSRGEGLGMQYLEAMASGVPVIACDWGAQTDYLNEPNSYLVKSYLKVIDDANYIVKCPQALNSQWCQVDIDNLRNTLRYVVNHYNEGRQKAQQALKDVREMTWQNMAVHFIREVVNMFEIKQIRPVPQEVLV